MKRAVRSWKFWAIAAVALAIGGTLVPLMVFGSGEGTLTVTPYADVVRFEAHGVASLQVQIYDLSGNLLWDSGVVSGTMVDWDRRDEWGERLAYGAYLYQAQGWNAQGTLVFQKSGKLALMPGDRVQLQAAPVVTPPESPTSPPLDNSITLQPMGLSDTGIFGKVGIGTSTPQYQLEVVGGGSYTMRLASTGNDAVVVLDSATTTPHSQSFDFYDRGNRKWRFINFYSSNNFQIQKYSGTGPGSLVSVPFTVQYLTDNVGIGTTSPAGKLDISNTANQPALRIEASAGTNLIEAYNTGSGSATGLIFRVERETGNVRADGAFYGAGFYSGSADVAEHINVSEPVGPGDVVEIDPEKPGYFRKARDTYSRLVAGVISSDPGVVLGSSSDPVEGEGDPRPVLALAGRVPVKATTENGPIQVGDLLVASSKPGYAMRCGDPASAVGAVIGKALEPLEEGEGFIMVQVILR